MLVVTEWPQRGRGGPATPIPELRTPAAALVSDCARAPACAGYRTPTAHLDLGDAAAGSLRGKGAAEHRGNEHEAHVEEHEHKPRLREAAPGVDVVDVAWAAYNAKVVRYCASRIQTQRHRYRPLYN